MALRCEFDRETVLDAAIAPSLEHHASNSSWPPFRSIIIFVVTLKRLPATP